MDHLDPRLTGQALRDQYAYPSVRLESSQIIGEQFVDRWVGGTPDTEAQPPPPEGGWQPVRDSSVRPDHPPAPPPVGSAVVPPPGERAR